MYREKTFLNIRRRPAGTVEEILDLGKKNRLSPAGSRYGGKFSVWIRAPAAGGTSAMSPAAFQM